MRFLADVHLGRLAKWLRLLGQDIAYDNKYSFTDMERIALSENRVILSKNRNWLKKLNINSLIIDDQNSYHQLKQVIEFFGLAITFRPFTRCINCNGLLIQVAKKDLVGQLKPNTSAFYDDFWQCEKCMNIYWKGSHYLRMQRWIESLLGDLGMNRQI